MPAKPKSAPSIPASKLANLEDENAALRAENAELVLALKEAQKAPKVPVARPDIEIGSLSSVDGVFALGSTLTIDQTWRVAGQVQDGRVAVDFSGPCAAYLVSRTQLPHEVLADGTLRVRVQSQPQGQHYIEQALQWLKREVTPEAAATKVVLSVLEASTVRCKDASRAQRAAVVADQGRPVYLALRSSSVRVSVSTDDRGEATVVHLHLT